MKFDTSKVKASDLISVADFVTILKDRIGKDTISSSTIYYHFNNTDELDYVEIGTTKYVVKNAKSTAFTPGNNYSKGDTRTRIDTT